MPRGLTWVTVLWTGILLTLVGLMLVTFLQDHCAGLTESALTSCQQSDSYQGLGFIMLFVLWLFGAAVLGLIWRIRRPDRRP
jgi:phosphate starvation-inducible membrane PsiE